jgi:tRNA A37 threonylcarbamoyladenosine modification protein TsaB
MGTLELMALPHLERNDSVCTMLDARKGEVYAAVYARSRHGGGAPLSRARAMVPPCAMTAVRFVSTLSEPPALLVGSGVLRYRDEIAGAMTAAGPTQFANPLDAPPPVAYLASIAHRLSPVPRDAVAALEPDYVRSSEAELKRLRETRP